MILFFIYLISIEFVSSNHIDKMNQTWIYLFFIEREGREKREGEKHQCEREMLIGCLLCMPRSGTESTA